MSEHGLDSSTRRKNLLRSACQIEGCSNPLPTATLYHRRYHICLEHASLASIKLNGTVVRFCQQCGRFQPLDEFDAQKHSCRRKLQQHNVQRKRARDAAKGAVAWDTSPAGSPRGSTGTVFPLRPLRHGVPEHERSRETTPQHVASDPGTPVCSPGSAPCNGQAPINTSVSAAQRTATLLVNAPQNTASIFEIDDLDIEELLQSWDDGTSTDGGLSSLGEALGGSVPFPPPQAAFSQPRPSETTEQAALPACPVSSFIVVPSANINTLVQPAPLLSSPPFFFAAMHVHGRQQSVQVMHLLPLAAPAVPLAVPTIAPAATTLPVDATDLAAAIPAENPTQKFRKTTP